MSDHDDKANPWECPECRTWSSSAPCEFCGPIDHDDTAERLAAIEARCEAATPGPWAARVGKLYETNGIVTTVCDIGGIDWDRPEDVEFVANSREDVPWLLTKVRELEAVETRLRGIIDSLHQAETGDMLTRNRLLVSEARWKLESALWRGDRDVELPEGWQRQGRDLLVHSSGVFVFASASNNVCLQMSAIPNDQPLDAGVFDTWHEAMKAAEAAVREAGGEE